MVKNNENWAKELHHLSVFVLSSAWNNVGINILLNTGRLTHLTVNMGNVMLTVNRGNVKRNNSSKICVWCLRMHVLFYIGIWTDSVDLTWSIAGHVRRGLKLVDICTYNRVWPSWCDPVRLTASSIITVKELFKIICINIIIIVIIQL